MKLRNIATGKIVSGRFVFHDGKRRTDLPILLLDDGTPADYRMYVMVQDKISENAKEISKS